MRKGFLGQVQQRLAMEERAEEVRLAETIEPERLVEDTALETDLIEGTERQQEVEAMDDDLARADYEFQSMEGLIEHMTIWAKDKGMDTYGAAAINYALEGYHERLGIHFSEQDYIALENFKGASSRQSATVIALEEQKGKLRTWINQAWEWLKSFLSKVVKAISDFLSASKRTEKRAKALKGKVKDTADFKEVKEAVKKRVNSKYAGCKTLGGGLSAIEEIIGKLRNKTIFDNAIKYYNSLGSIIEEVKKGVQSAKGGDQAFSDSGVSREYTDNERAREDTRRENENTVREYEEAWWGAKLFKDNPAIEGVLKEIPPRINDLVREMKPAGSGLLSQIKGAWDKGEGKYFIMSSNGPLPGDMALVAYVNDSGKNNKEEGTFEIPSVTFGFVALSDNPGEKAVTLPNNASAMSEICAKVENICKDHKTLSDNIKDFGKKVESAMSKIKNLFSEGMETPTRFQTFTRKIFSAVRSLVSGLTAPFSKFLVYSINMSKIALDVVAASLGEAKEESSEEVKDSTPAASGA